MPIKILTGHQNNLTFVPPRTHEEETLAHIWAEVLDVDQVGIHDPFFELGGHSLHATRIVARMQEAFEVEVSLQEFVSAPTIAASAGVLGRRMCASRSEEELEQLVTDLEQLSEEEVQQLLAENNE
jgi:acyl carrier protein